MWNVRSLVACLAVLCAFGARAQTTVYNNIPSPAGSTVHINGNATKIASNTITDLIADDITVSPSAVGLTISQMAVVIFNNNSTSVTVRPRLRFYDSSGTSGGPGTLIGQSDVSPDVTLTANSSLQLISGLPNFTIPAAAADSIDFWAGITFDDDNGTTGITASQLNNVGILFHASPAVGSSQDLFFHSTAAGDFASNNPSGSLASFGGSPVASFEWQFQATPEPGCLAIIGLGGFFTLRRRKSQKL